MVVRPDHPLTELTSSAAKRLSLAQLAEYPIVTYDRAFTGRSTIDEIFANQGIHPDIVLEAIDADVIKTYVDVGLGIGIIAGAPMTRAATPTWSACRWGICSARIPPAWA